MNLEIDISTTIECGDDEVAFFLRNGNEDSWKNLILKQLQHQECPKRNCYQVFRTKRILFNHFRDKHYNLKRQVHTKFENLIYAILQELSMFETAKGRIQKRQLVTHNLIKHLGIPLIDIALLLGIGTARKGELSYHPHPSIINNNNRFIIIIG